MELTCSGFNNSGKRVLAMGFFDGVHIGHGALLSRAKQRAEEGNGHPAVLTFDVHPDRLVFHRNLLLLGDSANRRELLHRCYGIDDVLFLHFDEETRNRSWQDFADYVKTELSVSGLVVGEDFTFGKHGEGTAEKLDAWCARNGLGCDVIPAVKVDGRPVSSTWIRSLVEAGDMEQANRLLGHPYCLTDLVRPGYHLGRTISAPTINMNFPDGVVIPGHGVYASKAILPDGTEHIAVTNVGVRPTVSDENRVNVETHILDFSQDLYDTTVRVDFYAFLRAERKFDSLSDLKAQINLDLQSVRNYFTS